MFCKITYVVLSARPTNLGVYSFIGCLLSRSFCAFWSACTSYRLSGSSQSIASSSLLLNVKFRPFWKFLVPARLCCVRLGFIDPFTPCFKGKSRDVEFEKWALLSPIARGEANEITKRHLPDAQLAQERKQQFLIYVPIAFVAKRVQFYSPFLWASKASEMETISFSGPIR